MQGYRRVAGVMLAAVLLMAQVGSAIDADGKLLPASESAILAGARTCIGATVDPAGQDARLVGWPSIIGNDSDDDKDSPAKRVASKDGVRLSVRTGVDGGCVVQAQGDAKFDKAAFYRDLSTLAGVAVPNDPQKPVTTLPNGEILVVQVGDEDGKTFVQLVIANPNGKQVKNHKGN